MQARHTGLSGIVLVALLTVTVGCNSPVGPESTAEPPTPAFLIGGSPLLLLLKDISGTEVVRLFEVQASVNKGIVQAKDEDKFQLRTTIRFSKDGGELFIDACIQKPTPDKDSGIRGGSDVPVTIVMVLTAAQYETLLSAAPNDGDTVDALVLLELILTDGKGVEHVLDSVSAASAVDPRDAL